MSFTWVVHVYQHMSQTTQILHAARAQRHQQVKGRDHSQRDRTHRDGLLRGEIPVGLTTLQHDLGGWEDEVLHEFFDEIVPSFLRA